MISKTTITWFSKKSLCWTIDVKTIAIVSISVPMELYTQLGKSSQEKNFLFITWILKMSTKGSSYSKNGEFKNADAYSAENKEENISIKNRVNLILNFISPQLIASWPRGPYVGRRFQGRFSDCFWLKTFIRNPSTIRLEIKYLLKCLAWILPRFRILKIPTNDLYPW